MNFMSLEFPLTKIYDNKFKILHLAVYIPKLDKKYKMYIKIRLNMLLNYQLKKSLKYFFENLEEFPFKINIQMFMTIKIVIKWKQF